MAIGLTQQLLPYKRQGYIKGNFSHAGHGNFDTYTRLPNRSNAGNTILGLSDYANVVEKRGNVFMKKGVPGRTPASVVQLVNNYEMSNREENFNQINYGDVGNDDGGDDAMSIASPITSSNTIKPESTKKEVSESGNNTENVVLNNASVGTDKFNSNDASVGTDPTPNYEYHLNNALNENRHIVSNYENRINELQNQLHPIQSDASIGTDNFYSTTSTNTEPLHDYEKAYNKLKKVGGEYIINAQRTLRRQNEKLASSRKETSYQKALNVYHEHDFDESKRSFSTFSNDKRNRRVEEERNDDSNRRIGAREPLQLSSSSEQRMVLRPKNSMSVVKRS